MPGQAPGPLVLNNYLSNRTQLVFINESSSCLLATNAGVPQGSMLGPLMFLIYVNDIADSIMSIKRIFADATYLSSSSKYSDEIKLNLENDFDKIHDWSVKWKIDFNPNKQNFFLLVTVRKIL